MATETTATIPNAVKTYYDKLLLENLSANFQHRAWADQGRVISLPRNAGKIVEWRRYGVLSAATTPLTEGTTPAGSNSSVALVTATPAQYGDFISYSDVLSMVSIDPVVSEFMVQMGLQAAETLDQVARDVLAAGTVVQYIGGGPARVNVAAANKLSVVELKKAARTLKAANAPKIMDSFGGSYVALIHPYSSYDLLVDAEFILASQYAGPGTPLYTGEIGRYGGIRFVETTNAKVFTGLGAAGIDVYGTLVFGAHFYGMAKWENPGGEMASMGADDAGNMVEMFLKPLGSSGSADPLNQRGTCGWKVSSVTKILNQSCAVRIEHAVT